MERLHIDTARGSPRFWVFLQGEVSTAAIYPLLGNLPTRKWHTPHQDVHHCPTIAGTILKIPEDTLSTDFFPRKLLAADSIAR